MEARMKNPAMVLPDAMKGINSLYKAAHSAGVPQETLELVHLRASQINGCSACVDMHAKGARNAGESEERVFAVAAWRETPRWWWASAAGESRLSASVARCGEGRSALCRQRMRAAGTSDGQQGARGVVTEREP